MAKLTLRHNGKIIKTLELEPGTEYFAGRDSNCDFPLEDFRGISRQHLKIYESGGVWCCESLSRFLHPTVGSENFEHLEMNESIFFSLTPYDFEFELAQAAQEEEAPSPVEAPQSSSSAGALVPASAAASFDEETNSSFSGDATAVGSIQLHTTLRICYPSSSDNETLKLEGQVWTAGRESDCEIQLHNPKISRRHFELVKNQDGYYVTDLGSSNGTYLNGQRIPPHEPTRVMSGDTLKTLDIEMHFEVKAANLPAVTAQPLPLANPWMNAPVPYYPPMGAGPYEYDATQIGAVPALEGAVAQGWKEKLKHFDWKKNKVRVILFALIPILIVGFFMDDGKAPEKVADTGKKESNASFENLSPEQKTAIKDSLNLARNLYVQGKYSLCLAELAKLHETVPFYDNSKELESFCIQGHELTQRKIDNERKEAEKMLVDQKIKDITEICDEKYKTQGTPEEVRKCLVEAIELNPQHPSIIAQMQRAEDRIREKELLAQRKAEAARERRVTLGIFHRAQRYKSQGNFPKAITYYKRFISRADGELSSQKHTAQRELASVSKVLQDKIDLALDKCRSLGNADKYKEAYKACEAALKENGELPEASKLKEKYAHKLRLQMKVIYQDAKLEESLGNLEAAKLKWKKIREEDLEVGDFYKKATLKLRQYGAI